MTATTSPQAFLANDELLSRLRTCTNLPSPPGVAVRIIELGQDPTADMQMIADAVSLDPALTTKILRIANSPLYARQRRTENLRQAIILLGLNGTLTLALSFSLVSTLRTKNESGIDYNLFWRRSLAAASCSRLLGARFNIAPPEDLFLIGLLQDIGMLAIDKVYPEFYRQLGASQSDHIRLQQAERAALGTDHADAGAWLLVHWNLPRHLVHAVAGSHDPSVELIDKDYALLARYEAVASAVADIWVREDHEQASQEAAQLADKHLGIDCTTLAGVLDAIGGEMGETAAMFEVDLGDTTMMETVLDQAREILMLRNLQSIHEAAELHRTAESLESRTRELEEQTRRDKLTGLYNRAHLDQVLDKEFDMARQHGWPLAVIFIDLDHFKQVNDIHGHHAGDEILRATARLLTANTRNTDIAARYGGEEFVLVLPGTSFEGARITCERVVTAFRTATHDIGKQEPVNVTVSAGLAIQGEGRNFDNAKDLVRAADQAVYAAKKQGRNRWVFDKPGL
jgi:diguanylate cyclase (GGDEF)-like protein